MAIVLPASPRSIASGLLIGRGFACDCCDMVRVLHSSLIMDNYTTGGYRACQATERDSYRGTAEAQPRADDPQRHRPGAQPRGGPGPGAACGPVPGGGTAGPEHCLALPDARRYQQAVPGRRAELAAGPRQRTQAHAGL